MAVDMFLKIDGIPGEALDTQHPDEIEVLSWSWGVSQTGTSSIGTGMGAGKANFTDFNFTMLVGKASTKLMLACATAKHIPTAELTQRRAGGEPVNLYKFYFKDLIISSISTGAGGDVPIESISFNYSNVKVEYYQQDAAGVATNAGTMSYDLKLNKAAAA